MLSNLDKDGKPSGKHPDRGTLYWHTDGSWKERTGQATMMYSEIVPSSGGETEFADMYSAYDGAADALSRGCLGCAKLRCLPRRPVAVLPSNGASR